MTGIGGQEIEAENEGARQALSRRNEGRGWLFMPKRVLAVPLGKFPIRSWEVQRMSRTKQKQLKRALPVAGVLGVSVALAGGAADAGTVGTTTDVKKDTSPPPGNHFQRRRTC